MKVTLRVLNVKSKRFCSLLKIEKIYNCFFKFAIKLIQRRETFENIAKQDFTCLAWNESFIANDRLEFGGCGDAWDFPPISYKIFKTNSSFHVKWRIVEKV